MLYRIVLDAGDDSLFRYNENWPRTDSKVVVARPKAKDRDEVMLDMRAVASEWFAAPPDTPEPYYWHDSPELTGAYCAHRHSGHTVNIEEVSTV